MRKEITLSDSEKTLCQFLVDVSEYIGARDGYTKPELRFTGGWVRDKLLDIQSNDIDIGINTMTGYHFGTLMKQYQAGAEGQAKYGHLSLGNLAKIVANPEKSKHLETVTTKILGFDIDLVNLRKETYAEDSRNPSMEFGSPRDDALRRDATVNSMFYNINTGDVEDLTELGFADLEKKIIRTPLDPNKTFKDDPLRVLRCIRFASKLGYRIDADAEKLMSDQIIKDAFQAKITRERVGIEVEKMMRGWWCNVWFFSFLAETCTGPNPHSALSFIDRLGLYNTIFADPTDPTDTFIVSTNGWARAYEGLSQISKSKAVGIEGSKESQPVRPLMNGEDSYRGIREILLRDEEDSYRAWILSALVPWARKALPTTQELGNKFHPSAAASALRKGLKADNKLCRVVEDAVSQMEEIITCKDNFHSHAEPTGSTLKRKRGAAGMMIHGWGPNWRCSVMVALLVQLMETETEPDREDLVRQYAAWLFDLQKLHALDACAVKPIVDGTRLMNALDRKGGKWMTVAQNIALEWQFENPEDENGDGAIAEVIRRKDELGLPAQALNAKTSK